MLSDYELFNQLCTKRGIHASAEVLDAMNITSSTGELRLPCLSIVTPICETIGRVLTSSSTIKMLDLSDCMLASKGLTHIFDALQQGTNIITLNLKGNNISGATVSQLGQVFHHNNTLKYLHLEWNNLGSDIESFQDFCKGLCTNYNIEELDLRYNQITPHCAEALANVLKKNKSLRVLNLAWNTLGLKGGQLILNDIMNNSNIVELNLRGNCIPDEILDSIDNYIFKNQSKKIISKLNIDATTTEMVKSVIHEDKNELMNNSIAKEEVIDDNFFKLDKSDPYKMNHVSKIDLLPENDDTEGTGLNKKIDALNKILQDRILTVKNLTDQMELKVEEIESGKLLNEQLKNELSTLKEYHENFAAEKTKEIADLTALQAKNEISWSAMYNELKKLHSETLLKCEEWKSKAQHYESYMHKSSMEIMKLRERWAKKSQHYEDIIANSALEITNVRGELKEKENKYRVDVNSVKHTLRETTQALEECQEQLQKTRTEFHETLANLSRVKSKINELEQLNKKYNQLQNSMARIKEEKLSIEEKLQDSERCTESLKRQLHVVQSELIEPQKRYELLKDELHQEKEKSTRLKQELSEERSRLKEQDVQIQKLNQQNTTLNCQLNDIQTNYAQDMQAREKDKKYFKDLIAAKERDLNDLKAEEAQRISQFYAAFSKYLSSMGSTTSTA